MSSDYTETLVSSRIAYDGKLLTLKEEQVRCRTAAPVRASTCCTRARR